MTTVPTSNFNEAARLAPIADHPESVTQKLGSYIAKAISSYTSNYTPLGRYKDSGRLDYSSPDGDFRWAAQVSCGENPRLLLFAEVLDFGASETASHAEDTPQMVSFFSGP